jgi:hypothetical protein
MVAVCKDRRAEDCPPYQSRRLNLRTGPSSPSAELVGTPRCSVRSSQRDDPTRAAPRKQQEGELDLKERWYPIQVKQKDKAGRPDIDAFEAMMMREDCEKGFFVSFDYTDDALREADAFFRRSGKSIVLFTVQEILEEHLAKKLA